MAALELKLAKAKLPFGRFETATVYDGNDAIYLLGGQGYHNETYLHTDEILKYTISLDTCEVVGKLPKPLKKYTESNAVINSEGKIYTFSGSSHDVEVMEFDTIENTPRQLPNIPDIIKLGYSPLIQTRADSVSIFGGKYSSFQGDILTCDLKTFEIEKKLNKFPNNSELLSGVWDAGKEEVLLLGSELDDKCKFHYYMLRYNENDGISRDIVRLSDDIPYKGPTVLANGSIHIISNDKAGPGGIHRINVSNFKESFLPVEGMMNSVVEQEAVFVPKLNRIYLFGGGDTVTEMPRDEIWYIDLPNDDGEFSTSARPDDSHGADPVGVVVPLIIGMMIAILIRFYF